MKQNTNKSFSSKDNTVNRLNIRVRLFSHHQSFHFKMQFKWPYMSGPWNLCVQKN